MSIEPVDVLLVDTSPSEDPIAGVLVQVYNRTTLALVTQSTTDADGLAGFSLDTEIPYQFRFWKFSVGFQNPQSFDVLEAPAENQFRISGVVLIPPVATDTRLCRASGYFRRATGQAAPFVDMHFIPKFSPILLEGSAVMPERTILRTDKYGYAVVDLIRFGEYDIYVQGMEDIRRTVYVPDLPSVNIGDLLFPVVGTISFQPTGAVEILVGEDYPLVPSIETTAGVPLLGTCPQEVLWETSDPTVAAVLVEEERLVIRGLSTGTTQLIASRRDTTVIRIPDTPIAGLPVDITVS